MQERNQNDFPVIKVRTLSENSQLTEHAETVLEGASGVMVMGMAMGYGEGTRMDGADQLSF